MATKYLVILRGGARHKVRNLKQAVALAGDSSFIAQKLLRNGKKSKVLRKYEVVRRMAHCMATKEV